jgi:hypothetical protein
MNRKQVAQAQAEIFYDPKGADLFAKLAKVEKPPEATKVKFAKWLVKKGITIPVTSAKQGMTTLSVNEEAGQEAKLYPGAQ